VKYVERVENSMRIVETPRVS